MNGTSGNDTLNGSASAETIFGAAGNDSLSGNAGNDVIYGDSLSETIASGAIANGGFSSGLAGWTTVTTPAPTLTNLTGTNSALAFNTGNSTAGGAVEQAVTTTPGAAYTLGYMIGETGTGNGTHTFRIDILDANGNVIATRTDVVANDATQNLSITYTAVSSSTTIRVTNTATSNTTSSDGFIDNIVNAATVDDPFSATDILSGGTGDDTLYGGVGADTLSGDDGNDVLYGGSGSDSMLGGGGNDRFVFSAIDNNAGRDTSVSYSPGTITPSVVNTTLTGSQSPPKMILLADGRIMHVWAENGASDGVTTMDLQLRIFNADGTAASNQVSLASWPAISGNNLFDWDHLDLDRLASGDVVISYARNSAETGGTEPIFGIVRPNTTASGVTVITSPTEVQQSDVTAVESPPVTTELPNGNVLFVWARNGTSDDITSMTLQGRIFDPSTGNFGNEFQVGNVAVDGSVSDFSSLSVTTLTGGNVVVAWWRNNAETGFAEPVYTILDQTGATVAATAEIEGTDNENQSTVWESAPVIQALPNGNWIGLWVNDGFSDNLNSMTLEARIFDASGNALSGDIRIGSTAVDGGDDFNMSNVTVATLSDGRVVIGYVETGATGASSLPFFTILDTATGATIVSDVSIAVSPSSQTPGPPLIEVLGDSGYFVAVYVNGNGESGVSTGLNYRIFDRNGNAVSSEITITTAAANSALSGNQNFDWDSVDLVYNPTNQTFTVGWVGTNDSNGTGVYTSGPISVSYFTSPPLLTRDEIVIGGETGETTGDILDLSTMTESVTVAFSGAEAGAVTGNSGGQRITFSEIERIDLGLGNDSVTGGAGNDWVFGGSGNDTLLGEAGNDILDGGAGSDRLEGGDGNDTLTSGLGSDTLVGGAGIDTADYSASAETIDINLTAGTGGGGDAQGDSLSEIEVILGSAFYDNVVGSAAAETLVGNGGDDNLFGHGGADQLEGGTGNDYLVGDVQGDAAGGSDTIFGGSGNDTLIGAEGADSLYGGDDNDLLYGGQGETGGDLLDGGAGIDTADYSFSSGGISIDLTTGSGSGGDAQGDTLTGIEIVAGSNFADTLAGSTLSDSLFGGMGADSIAGGAGNDLLDGGMGNDTLIGGTGGDTLSGGVGEDRFVLMDGGGADRITDFDLTRINGFAVDRLDVSGMTDALGNPVYWADVTITDTVGDGSGDAILTFPNGQSVTLQGVTPAQVTGRRNLQAIGVPCFAAGTAIRTPEGWRDVADIVAGDLVLTSEGRAEPVIWAGSRSVLQAELEAHPSLRPVKVKAGVLGNRSDIRLSPQHAVLMLLDGVEVLVRAVHLARHGYRGCRIAEGTRRIVYHHLLLPEHAILDADGMSAESLYPGHNAIAPLDRRAQAEIAAAVRSLTRIARKEISEQDDLARLYGPTVRPVLSGSEVAQAIARGALHPALRGTAVAVGAAMSSMPACEKRPMLKLVHSAA